MVDATFRSRFSWSKYTNSRSHNLSHPHSGYRKKAPWLDFGPIYQPCCHRRAIPNDQRASTSIPGLHFTKLPYLILFIRELHIIWFSRCYFKKWRFATILRLPIQFSILLCLLRNGERPFFWICTIIPNLASAISLGWVLDYVYGFYFKKWFVK